MVLDSCLLHDPICNVPDANFPVYREVSVTYRAVPDVMIAFTAPHKITPVFP
jgi:hypothetical protein